MNIRSEIRSLYRKNCVVNIMIKMKQVAQRATIAHLSPTCHGQILFKESGDTDVLEAQGQLTPQSVV